MHAVQQVGFQLIMNGWVLVDTFYVLSGALAVYSVMKSIGKSDGRVSFVASIVNRLARLVPVLWFTLALLFVINHVSAPVCHVKL